MKVLVTVKRVIDYKVKVRIKEDNSDVDLQNTKMSMNPFCEIAVEEAVRLKEKNHASEIICLSIGSQECEEQLRTALAMGADRGILIKTEQPPAALTVAKLVQAIVEKEQVDLVIMGKQAIDSDNNQTGQMLAALLNWGQGTFASKVELENNAVLVTRELDEGLGTIQLKLPAVITTDLRLNTPRYISLPNIIKAKKKTIDVINADTFNIALHSCNEIVKVEPPPKRKAGIIVDSVDTLIEKLKNEAKVL